MATALVEGRPLSSEYRLLRPDGTERLVRVDATALRGSRGDITGFIGVSTDISTARALQEQLAINARLAAMATLVGGLAHEINNPLAAVSAAGSWAADVVGTLRDQLALGPPRPPATQADQLDEVLETLHEVRLGADRIAALVKKLVRFGHPSRERRPLHLRDVVTQTLRWMPVAAAGRVEIEVRDLGAPKVLGSEDELAQVVVNLLTNAVQSIPEDRTGHVVVRLGPGGRGRSRLEVEDDGVGIPPEVAGRIFDPFFTTRDVGQGMGLGLAVAHAIVRAHEGTLEVSSTPGAGATLRMELPALNDAAPPPPLGGR
jgi:signal transduction histidine kinase